MQGNVFQGNSSYAVTKDLPQAVENCLAAKILWMTKLEITEVWGAGAQAKEAGSLDVAHPFWAWSQWSDLAWRRTQSLLKNDLTKPPQYCTNK